MTENVIRKDGPAMRCANCRQAGNFVRHAKVDNHVARIETTHTVRDDVHLSRSGL